jgi:hypothetical protein
VGRRDGLRHPSSPAIIALWEGGGGWLKLRNPEVNIIIIVVNTIRNYLHVNHTWGNDDQ